MGWTLVTGGSRRLGACIALSMAKAGRDVLIHYDRSEEHARRVVRECIRLGVKAEMVRGDFSTNDGIKKFINIVSSQFGPVQNLINNVGPYLVKPATETDLDEWSALFQLNVHAPFALTNAFLPSITAAKGSVINIGTVGLGTARANVMRSAYVSAKMALWMLTKSLARELVASGVRVNMVSPGYLENSIDLPEDPKLLPMARAASLDEVARVITFLLDPASGYITGQNIEVGGGVNL